MTEQLRPDVPGDLDQQGDYGQYVQRRLTAREQTEADAGRIDELRAQRHAGASAGDAATAGDAGGVEGAIRDRRARSEQHDRGRSWPGDQ